MNAQKLNAVLDAAEELEAAVQNLKLDPALKSATDRLCEAAKALREAQKLPVPLRMIWIEVSGGVAEVSLPYRLPPGWAHEIIDYDNLQEEIQTEARFYDLPVFLAHRILQTNPYFLERIQRAEKQAAEEAEQARQQRRKRFVELAKDLTPDDYRELAAELAPTVQAIAAAQAGESASGGALRGSR